MKKKPNGYRYFCHLTGCLFGIFILAVLIINFLVPDRGFSQKENRVLASRPAISVSQLTSGKFADGYETYVNDQFFLRDWWITLRATAQRILGNTEENGVFLGKNGYLMEDFTAPSQERLNRTVNAMIDFAARHSDLFHVGRLPNKTGQQYPRVSVTDRNMGRASHQWSRLAG